MKKSGYSLQNVLRYTSLTILTFQTTMTVLAMRYSRKASDGKDIYIGSTMILMSEVIKFVLCFLVLLLQKSGSILQTANTFCNEVLKKPSETIKLSVPSTLYTIQNNLIILALSNLDAATFQITYQLKILTTAFFSVLLLRKEIKFVQWVSLVILMFGVVFVQLPSGHSQSGGSVMTARRLVGLLAVLVSSLSSGFAGVFYEKLLKESSQPSVVIRNLQLGIFSIIFGAVGVVVSDGDKVYEKGFFSGYQPVVWVVIMLQATGGLLVAAVIKYADNILKGFATSVSIILSCLFSYIVLRDLELQPSFVMGTALVIGATFLYGLQSHPPSSTSSPEITKVNLGRHSPRLSFNV